MKNITDKWHRLYFCQESSSSESEAEEGSVQCTCARHDPQGNTSLGVLSLDRTCVVTPAILKNLIVALFGSDNPEESAFQIPHWIRFERNPTTIFLVECSHHTAAFPLCEQHHLRYASTGASLMDDIFLTPVRPLSDERKRKAKRNPFREQALRRLKERRRDEEELIIRQVIGGQSSEDAPEVFSVTSTYRHDPDLFVLSRFQRTSLGVFHSTDASMPSSYTSAYKRSPHRRRHLVSLDCEMVITTGGYEVARISAVDVSSREVLYDAFVRPKGAVTSYLTKFSGITKRTLRNIDTTLEDARAYLLEKVIFEDTVVVGHAVHNDLKLLRIAPRHIVDISLLYPKHCVENPSGVHNAHANTGGAKGTAKTLNAFLSAAEAKSLGIEGTASTTAAVDISRGFQLKMLAFWFLGRHIQSMKTPDGDGTVGHDSIEDANACADLFRLKLEHGKDFGLDALLYYSSGQVVRSIAEDDAARRSAFDMRGVIDRMRNMKNIDEKYRCKDYRSTQIAGDKKAIGNWLGGATGIFAYLRRMSVEFQWYENHDEAFGEKYRALPAKQRIDRLRHLKKYLPVRSKGLVFLTLPEPPSHWNLIEFGNHLHEEYHEVDPEGPAPFVIFLTHDEKGASSVLFH